MENVMERLEAKRTYEVELIGDPPYHDEHGNVRPDIKWLPLVKSAAKGIEGTAAEIAAYILERRLDAETCAYDPYFEVLELSESDEARVRRALYEIEVGYSHNGSGVRAPSAIPRREPKSVWIHFTRVAVTRSPTRSKRSCRHLSTPEVVVAAPTWTSSCATTTSIWTS
jgi:hypothetical protein